MRETNKQLKIAIIERGLSQRQLAAAAGMHEATLSLIVNGVYNPSAGQREKIARILERPPEDLFHGEKRN